MTVGSHVLIFSVMLCKYCASNEPFYLICYFLSVLPICCNEILQLVQCNECMQ